MEALGEGIYVHLQLIHMVVLQILTGHCKAMILQLKINVLKSKFKKSGGFKNPHRERK